MADNVPVTPGSGALFRTDDVGGVHYQVIKIALGADGVAVFLKNGQQVASDCLPVVLASDHPPIAVRPADADNRFGQALGVAAGGVDTVVTWSPGAGKKLCGFMVTGNGDGTFFIEIDGIRKYSCRTNISAPSVVVLFPNPDAAVAGHVVDLLVMNDCEDAANFEGTLFGV